jgi:hypothetical protein
MTFDSSSRFVAKNLWSKHQSLGGPGLGGVARLSDSTDSITTLELPMRGELFRCAIGPSNVLAVYSEGEFLSFFDLPVEPCGVPEGLYKELPQHSEVLLWASVDRLDEEEESMRAMILKSSGIETGNKKKRPFLLAKSSRGNLILTLIDNQIHIVRKGDSQVNVWKMPLEINIPVGVNGLPDSECKISIEAFVLDKLRYGFAINEGFKTQILIFKIGENQPIANREVYNVSTDIEGDFLTSIENGKKILIRTAEGFCILDGFTLAELNQYRFDPILSDTRGGVDFIRSMLLHLFYPADLSVDEAFLSKAEYIGGWRFNAKGEYEPVAYSEEYAKEIKAWKNGQGRGQ